MNESSRLEYCLLRYVPTVIRDDSVAVAVIFIDSSDLENGICTMSFATDWQTKVLLLDPNSDLEMLGALLREILARLLSPATRSEMIRELEDSFSNVIQITERRKSPIASAPESIEAFACTLLESKKPMSLSAVHGLTCQTQL